MDEQQAGVQRARVSSIGYWIGALLMVGGVFVGGYVFVTQVVSIVKHWEHSPRVAVPTDEVVSLPRDGEHTVMAVFSSRDGSGVSELRTDLAAEAVRVEVYTVDGNDQLYVSRGVDMTTEMEGEVAHLIGRVDLGSRREVRIRTWLAEEELPIEGSMPALMEDMDVEVCLTKLNLMDVGMQIIGGGGIGAVSFVVGLVLIIITAVRRSKNPSPPTGVSSAMGPQTNWQQPQPPVPPRQRL